MPRGEKPSRGRPAASSGGSYTSASAVSGGFGPGARRITAPGKLSAEPQVAPSGAGDTA
jgi:hypothetical protein